MFTDSDWDNVAPPPAAPPSTARHGASLAIAVAAGIALGIAGSSWWWASHGERHTAAAAGSRPIAASPTPAEVVASAPPSAGAPSVPQVTAPVVIAPSAPLPPRTVPTASSVPAAPGDPAAAVRRKELAWSRWYEKPRECIEDRRGERLVECANHYIRARREFEAAYAQR